MKNILHYSFIVVILILSSCSKTVQPAQKAHIEQRTKVLLISMDGFRWDYLDLVATPNLDHFISHGVKAESLKPSFPSKTFPNHYTIVSGSYPANHGLISNKMYDDKLDDFYKIGKGSSSVLQSKWYQREPIWVTAEKNKIKSGVFFWPGSEAKINGYYPSEYKKYNPSTSWNTRINQIVDWLEQPEFGFAALYFNEPDHQGHRHGPGSPEVIEQIEKLDKVLGDLFKQIEQKGLSPYTNIIITSDHGMASTQYKDAIFLDDYIDMSDVQMVDWNPVAAIRPKEGKFDKVYNALKGAHPHLNVYNKDEMPSKYNYKDNNRIQPITAVADLHYTITTHGGASYPGTRGTHGYDPDEKDMHAIFLAKGPAFKSGATHPTFQNIHIYALMCKILDIDPSLNDGDFDEVKGLLK